MTTSSGKYYIGTGQNHNYDDVLLYDNIFVGDSILKSAGSDTVFICRNHVRLEFVLGGVIP